MIDVIYPQLLWIAVIWPLLLAFPTLGSRLLWSLHLALLPALLLLLLPGDLSLSFSWLLLGSGLAIDGDVRWMLAMTLGLWFLLAGIPLTARPLTIDTRVSPLLLLTLSGNLGSILSHDLILFFSFNTLMGYALYGLLTETDRSQHHHSTRQLLMLLVAADLLLFEALLLASFHADDLQFLAVRQQIAESSSAHFYLFMALLGFALRMGLWPTQRWLLQLYGSTTARNRLLLSTIPVSMAMLGAIRWLPLGEQAFAISGLLIQLLGAAALAYAGLGVWQRFNLRQLPGWLSLIGSGLLLSALGYALTDPEQWRQYQQFAHPLIAIHALLIALSSLLTNRFPRLEHGPELESSMGRWAQLTLLNTERWGRFGLASLQGMNQGLRAAQTNSFLRYAKPLISRLGGWSNSITLLVVLAIAVAWLAARFS